MLALDPHQSALWLQELIRFLPLNLRFIVTGNVHDLHLQETAPGEVVARPLAEIIEAALRGAGFTRVVRYDLAKGFHMPGASPDENEALLASIGLSGAKRGERLEFLQDSFARFLALPGGDTALVIDFASTLFNPPGEITPAEHEALARVLIGSYHARELRERTPGLPIKSIIWIVDKDNDVPDWLVVGNPHLRHVPVALPETRERRMLADSLLRRRAAETGEPPDAVNRAVAALTAASEGMLLFDIASIVELGRCNDETVSEIRQSAHRYKVGSPADPWANIDRQRIADGARLLGDLVKGQGAAIGTLVDIVKRAQMGLGGARHCGPRGFAFFAGPVGVGKNGLGRALATLLTGRTGDVIYFNMAEFSFPKSVHRLFGAPVGYTGYDHGGELLRAVRQKPFSVLFLDEVEKVHPLVLDQITRMMDRGAVVSPRGDRAYLCDVFLVLCTNLGLYKTESDGNLRQHVFPTDPYDAVRNKIWLEIERHFTHTVDRRDMLNRVAGNIVYFDFIRPNTAGDVLDQIMESELSGIAARQGIVVKLAPEVRAQLRQLCVTDLASGGHGIRSRLRWFLINPLAAALFDRGPGASAEVLVEALGTATSGAPGLLLR